MQTEKLKDFAKARQAKQPKTTMAEGILTKYPMTDLGNAERLVYLYGDQMRYCFAWKKFIIWDGKRWNTDDNGALRRLCKGMIRKLQEEALGIEQDDTRQRIMKYAIGIESDMKIKAMINLAQAEEGIGIRPDDLDRDKYLLTCNNGTLDLKTGKLLKHNSDDLITKLAPVDYLPDAECPMWRAHLKKIMGGKDELINFIQKVFGYCLTGDTSERAIFILYGDGANGKSITLIVIAWILGDYATRTPTDTLLAKQNDGIPNDVARLKGARMAYASEAEQGKKLAESKVKDLTGGETIVARFLHGEFFEFVPEFKLILGTNHKPKIRGTDAAIWDRIRLIPFNVRIPERDRIQKEKMLSMFESELPGILSWMVQGCLAWQKEGLAMPVDVAKATGEYRHEMDVLGDFLDDCCIIDSNAQVTKKDLYDKYLKWAQDNGEKEFSKKLFSTMISERGFDEYRGTGGVREWVGIKVDISDR